MDWKLTAGVLGFVQVLGAAQDAGAADLRRVTREPVARDDREARPLLDAGGQARGSWTLEREQARLRLAGRELLVPPLQLWSVSPDGRTLVGVGDERAPEHPFELEVLIYREGVLAARLAERFDPESEVVVGDDGTVALVGQLAGERGRPLALLERSDGTRSIRALAAGTTARDPVLVGEALLLRSAGLPGTEHPGAIVRVDALGVRTLREAPELLGLIGLPRCAQVLVHERDALSLVDAETGEVRWRRAASLRPAGRGAWHLWRSEQGEFIALVTAEVRRRGAGTAPPLLELFGLADGSARARVALEPGGPPGAIRLQSAGTRLVVKGLDVEEVFAW